MLGLIMAHHVDAAAPAARTEADIGEMLRTAGLRPTRQRLALGTLLFGKGDRHVSAELLHAEAVRAGERVSLATVYNTLHQFKRAGLVRELAIEGKLMDIPPGTLQVNGLPEVPEGLRISHVDVVVRLIRKPD
jgi:Fur family iron response transcriptional regulator